MFDTAGFVPRWSCGDWSPALGWTYIVANAVIAAAYFAIPLLLLVLWQRRRGVLPQSGTLLWFAAFVLLCGWTHVADTLAFWWPAYRFYTVVRAVTAGVSLVTACLLPRVIQHLLTCPTQEEYRQTVERLELESTARQTFQRQLEGRNERLRLEADEMRKVISELEWREELKNEVLALREHLHKIRNV